MKHLYYKLKAFIRLIYLRLSVVLTLGIRGAKDSKDAGEEDSQKGDYK